MGSPPGRDKVELTWYGTAALVLREGETAIAFDPFDGFPPGRSPEHLPHEEALRDVAAVFVTHGHLDHILHIPRLYGQGEVPIYCTKTPAATLVRHGLDRGRLREIAPGWTGQVGPFTLAAWQGKHCKFDPPMAAETVLRGTFFRELPHAIHMGGMLPQYREGGEILFYQVTCGETRVQIMGSMGLHSEVDYPTGAELLVLPFQGRSDREVYAMGLVERLRPKAVALDHYDDSFPPITQEVQVGDFEKQVERRLSIPCHGLEKGHRLVLDGK